MTGDWGYRAQGVQIEEKKPLLSWGHPSFWGVSPCARGLVTTAGHMPALCLNMVMTRGGRLAFLGSHLLKYRVQVNPGWWCLAQQGWRACGWGRQDGSSEAEQLVAWKSGLLIVMAGSSLSFYTLHFTLTCLRYCCIPYGTGAPII